MGDTILTSGGSDGFNIKQYQAFLLHNQSSRSDKNANDKTKEEAYSRTKSGEEKAARRIHDRFHERQAEADQATTHNRWHGCRRVHTKKR